MSHPSDPVVTDTALGPVAHADSGGDGPVVLFVHGTPGGWDQGELMGRFLVDAGFRVVAPSRPGYPGTPIDDDDRTPAEQAARHAALLDALGVERCSVVCWSGGGPSSYHLAAEHSDRVASMVAVAALSGPYAFEHPGEERALFSRPGAWLMRELARHAPHATVKSMTTEEGDLPKADAKELVDAIWSDPQRRQWVLDWVGTVSGGRRAGFDNDVEQYETLELPLGSVEAPVLLVHADTDADVPIDHSHHAAEVLPRAELVTIADGTHISLWTGPDDEATRARVVAFLSHALTGTA